MAPNSPVRYQRLVDLSRDLISTLDLEELLTRIVDAAAELCDAQAASILLYDETTRQLHFEAATGMQLPFLKGVVVPVDSSIAGWIIQNRQPVLITDAQMDKRHFNLVGEATNIKTTSLIGVPLLNRDRVVGVLEAINKTNGQFTDEDQELLVALAAQATVSIENARLSQQADLISELVHELRTPLGSLAAAAHLLNRPQLTQDERIELAQTIRSEINRLSDMATGYLDLARLESGRSQFNAEPVDLVKLLQECAQIIGSRVEEREQSLLLQLPDIHLSIRGDYEKLKQVVLNLLSNASNYTPIFGTINVTAWASTDQAIFSVSDNGTGISNTDLTRIFTKFYRVPGTAGLVPGTGLGLSICERIVEAHQGWIEVDSQLGQGTTFTVHFPIYQEFATTKVVINNSS